MTIWEQIRTRKLEQLAYELWLPKTATREEVGRAIEQLSDSTRREGMRRRLQQITAGRARTV